MKPLELAVYPKVDWFWKPITVEVRGKLETGYHRVEAGYSTPNGHVEEHQATVEARAKHLRKSELAAEYWRHEGDYRMLTDGYAVESFGVESLVPGPSSEERSRAQLDTLLRFASTPHYFEQP